MKSTLSEHAGSEAVPGETSIGVIISRASEEEAPRENRQLPSDSSEELYRLLAQTSPYGILTTDAQGTLTYVNPALEKMFDIPFSISIGTHFQGYITLESARKAEELFLGAMQGRIVRDIELVAIHRDQHTFPIEIAVSPILKSGQFSGIECIVRDITDRKRAEEGLRESENRYRRLIENLKGSHFIYVHDTNGVFQYLDESVTDILGYTPEEFMAHYSKYMTDHPANQAVYRYTELSIQGIRQPPYEVNLWHKDGSSRWLEVQEVPVFDANDKVVAVEGVAQDITERKRAEEALLELNATLETKVAQRTEELNLRARQLQKLTLDMSEAEDRERKRIAEILHDDLQQVLAAAKFHLGLMRSQAGHNPSLQAIGAEIDQMLKDAIEKSRSLSHELSPAVLHHGDFAEVLEWLARQMHSKYGLAVHVHASGQVNAQSDTIKEILYKAAHELLFNIIKHAQVNEAVIRVRRLRRCICLSVSDRGRGFDPQELGQATGLGLSSIRERAELLGGRMKIKSTKGKGSTFLLAILDDERPGTGAGCTPETNVRSKEIGRIESENSSQL